MDKIPPFLFPFTEEEVNNYLLTVHAEIYHPKAMSQTYHYRVGDKLYEGVMYGLKRTPEQVNPASPYHEAMRNMRHNVYRFSAAKQYSQLRALSNFITFRGEKSTFTDFHRFAKPLFDEYNKHYLEVEWNTAIATSQMVREWIDLNERGDNPMIQYRSQRDMKVRPEHRALDGIIMPLKSSFWDRYWPPNGWNCRCFTVTLAEGQKKTDLSERDLSVLDNPKTFPKEFRINVGKEMIALPENHPYFDVDKGDIPLRDRNFDMPIP